MLVFYDKMHTCIHEVHNNRIIESLTRLVLMRYRYSNCEVHGSVGNVHLKKKKIVYKIRITTKSILLFQRRSLFAVNVFDFCL